MPAEGAALELLRLLCGTAERRAADRARAAEVLARTDVTTLARAAERQRLLGIVPGRLRSVGLDEAAQAIDDLLGDRPAQRRARGQQVQLITLALLLELERASIRALPLKGPLMGEALYGDAGVRPSDDIDLLVGRDQLHAATALIRARGYGAPTDPTDAAGLPLLHLCLRGERPSSPNVEIHWRLHWHEAAFSAELLERSPTDPQWGRRPPAAYELACLLLFYARDAFAGLRLACDLGAFADSERGRSLEPGALEPIIDRFPELARTFATAAVAAEQTVGFPAAALLGRHAGAASPVAGRLVNWRLSGDAIQIRAEQGLVDVVLAPSPLRRATLRRQLFPTRDQMAWMMRNASPGRLRLRQVLHPPSTAVRWLRAGWSLRTLSTRRASRSPGTA